MILQASIALALSSAVIAMLLIYPGGACSQHIKFIDLHHPASELLYKKCISCPAEWKNPSCTGQDALSVTYSPDSHTICENCLYLQFVEDYEEEGTENGQNAMDCQSANDINATISNTVGLHGADDNLDCSGGSSIDSNSDIDVENISSEDEKSVTGSKGGDDEDESLYALSGLGREKGNCCFSKREANQLRCRKCCKMINYRSVVGYIKESILENSRKPGSNPQVITLVLKLLALIVHNSGVNTFLYSLDISNIQEFRTIADFCRHNRDLEDIMQRNAYKYLKLQLIRTLERFDSIRAGYLKYNKNIIRSTINSLKYSESGPSGTCVDSSSKSDSSLESTNYNERMLNTEDYYLESLNFLNLLYSFEKDSRCFIGYVNYTRHHLRNRNFTIRPFLCAKIYSVLGSPEVDPKIVFVYFLPFFLKTIDPEDNLIKLYVDEYWAKISEDRDSLELLLDCMLQEEYLPRYQNMFKMLDKYISLDLKLPDSRFMHWIIRNAEYSVSKYVQGYSNTFEKYTRHTHPKSNKNGNLNEPTSTSNRKRKVGANAAEKNGKEAGQGNARKRRVPDESQMEKCSPDMVKSSPEVEAPGHTGVPRRIYKRKKNSISFRDITDSALFIFVRMLKRCVERISDPIRMKFSELLELQILISKYKAYPEMPELLTRIKNIAIASYPENLESLVNESAQKLNALRASNELMSLGGPLSLLPRLKTERRVDVFCKFVDICNGSIDFQAFYLPEFCEHDFVAEENQSEFINELCNRKNTQALVSYLYSLSLHLVRSYIEVLSPKGPKSRKDKKRIISLLKIYKKTFDDIETMHGFSIYDLRSNYTLLYIVYGFSNYLNTYTPEYVRKNKMFLVSMPEFSDDDEARVFQYLDDHRLCTSLSSYRKHLDTVIKAMNSKQNTTLEAKNTSEETGITGNVKMCGQNEAISGSKSITNGGAGSSTMILNGSCGATANDAIGHKDCEIAVQSSEERSNLHFCEELYKSRLKTYLRLIFEKLRNKIGVDKLFKRVGSGCTPAKSLDAALGIGSRSMRAANGPINTDSTLMECSELPGAVDFDIIMKYSKLVMVRQMCSEYYKEREKRILGKTENFDVLKRVFNDVLAKMIDFGIDFSKDDALVNEEICPVIFDLVEGGIKYQPKTVIFADGIQLRIASFMGYVDPSIHPGNFLH